MMRRDASKAGTLVEPCAAGGGAAPESVAAAAPRPHRSFLRALFAKLTSPGAAS